MHKLVLIEKRTGQHIPTAIEQKKQNILNRQKSNNITGP